MKKLLFLFLFLASILNAQEVNLKKSPEQVNAELMQHIKPGKENRVGKIVIDDRKSGINQGTWVYVKNALDYYKKNPPLFLILELSTPGGEVFEAQKISDALKEMDTQYNVPVVAFINNWAISAGAMLAYSTRFISVVKDASMGAAEPVLQDTTSGEMKTTSEKVNSAIRADFSNRASFFDRNPVIAEAMVDKDMILVYRDGKIIKVDAENQIKPTDVIISPKGKLLTLNSEQLIDYGVADIYLPPERRDIITDHEKEQGKWPARKEMLFEYPFFHAFQDSTVIDQYEMDVKTRFLSFLAMPAVSSILLLAVMIGFYIEINTPGFGLAGTVAVTALFLLILSSFAVDIANWLELILLITGLLIITVDLFVLPTFGLIGFVGVLLFFAGLFGLLLPGIGSIGFEVDTQTFNAAGEAFLDRFAWIMGTFILGLVIIVILARYMMPNLGTFKKFVLEGHEQVGYYAGVDPKMLPQIGAKGRAVTHLRPAGKVEIDGKWYDAMSSGRFIERDSNIVVIRSEGSEVVVEEVT